MRTFFLLCALLLIGARCTITREELRGNVRMYYHEKIYVITEGIATRLMDEMVAASKDGLKEIDVELKLGECHTEMECPTESSITMEDFQKIQNEFDIIYFDSDMLISRFQTELYGIQVNYYIDNRNQTFFLKINFIW